MKWVRCPQCRMVNDLERYAMCDGCFADLAGRPVLREADPPPREVSIAARLVRALGKLAMTGLALTVFASRDLVSPISILTFFALFLFLVALSGQYLHRAHLGTFATAVVGLFAFAGALACSVFGVLAACTLNGAWSS